MLANDYEIKTLKDLAQAVGCSIDTAVKYVRAGVLPKKKNARLAYS